MQVLLIGAGRYGNGLVGRKYIKGELGAKLAGVVDPKIDEIKSSETYCLKGVPTYHSIEEVPQSCIRDSISELAVIPQIVPDSFKTLINKGAKKIILPKPIATTRKDFQEILSIAEDDSIDAVVASNWHYSNITKMTKALINKLTDNPISSNENFPKDFTSKLNDLTGGYEIEKVEVEYNKKFETLDIDPPMQELPHAMQIVYSTGCTDLKNPDIIMRDDLQSPSRVNVRLKNTKSVKDGIDLNSDLRMQERLIPKRERLLKVYLNKNGEKVTITTDYDAQFTPTGICIKRPSIKFEALGYPDKNWEYKIDEDNMNVMYNSMLAYLDGKKNDSLTVENYSPIAQTLCSVEEIWNTQKNK